MIGGAPTTTPGDLVKDGSDDCWDVALSPNGDTLAVIRDHRIQFWSVAAARK